MKKTALYDKHVSLDAKMVPFAGYDMPVSYTGIIKEHQTVRERVGMFDVSHMGEFILKGEGALDLIQRVTSNDASKLEKGDAQYSCFPNGKGGIVDDLLVYKLGEEEYMLVVNASNIEKDWNWVMSHNTAKVEMKNISEGTSLMAVQGPDAVKALQKLTEVDLGAMEYYTFVRGTFAGVDNVIISATGYTGSGGFEIYVANENAAEIWDAIMDAGAEYGIEPIGLGARDTLRLEMGYCLYGNDIDDTTSSLEAGLGWITKLKKESDFVDKQFMIDQKAAKISRKLVGFEVSGKRPPRQGYPIVDADGNVIGVVTSGTKGPSVNISIGMGYVARGHFKKGSPIFIDIRGKKVEATVVGLPFYKVK